MISFQVMKRVVANILRAALRGHRAIKGHLRIYMGLMDVLSPLLLASKRLGASSPRTVEHLRAIVHTGVAKVLMAPFGAKGVKHHACTR